MSFWILKYIIDGEKFTIIARAWTLEKAQELIEKNFFPDKKKTFVGIRTTHPDMCQDIIFPIGPLLNS